MRQDSIPENRIPDTVLQLNSHLICGCQGCFLVVVFQV